MPSADNDVRTSILWISKGQIVDNTATEFKKIDLSKDSHDLRLSRAGDGRYETRGYVSKLFDSYTPGPNWYFIRLDADVPEKAFLSILLQSSDDNGRVSKNPPEPDYGGMKPGEYAIRRVKGDECIVFHGPIQGPLHPRYMPIRAGDGGQLRLTVYFKGDGESTPALRDFEVNCAGPCPSFLSYLPAIYAEADAGEGFLEEFLKIFERQLYGIESLINDLPSYFDPLQAPCEFIPWLASWLSLDLYELLGEKNREFVKNAYELYKWKGTKIGLEKLVKTLTGRDCFVKEYNNNVFRSYLKGEHDELDGSNEKDEGNPRIYRKTSRSFKSDLYLESKLKPYMDETHYTFDSGNIYHPNCIGIFLLPGDSALRINESELKEMISAFVPVFVRMQVFVLTREWFEKIKLGGVKDSLPGLKWITGHLPLLSFKKDPLTEEDVINNIKYRTYSKSLKHESGYKINEVMGGVNLNGSYKDIRRKGNVTVETDWKPNTIAGDCGRFMAALLKGDLAEARILYIAFSNGKDGDQKVFWDRVCTFFSQDPRPGNNLHLLKTEPPISWVWAKEIKNDSIKYIDKDNLSSNKITNTLQIDIMVKQHEPISDKTLDFTEFGLVGSGKVNGKEELFLINYVNHKDDIIPKSSDYEFQRTIKLEFAL